MDEIVDGLPQPNEVVEQVIETPVTQDTPPMENTTPAVETFKLKYNHEEREIPLEEARELAQKGMNYDKAIERAKQEAYQASRDAFIAEQNYEWNGRTITTEADYKKALREQAHYEKLSNQNLPEEIIHELVANKSEREERQAREQEQKQSEEQNKQYSEFFEYFEKKNGHAYDASKDNLPSSVWEDVAKGKTILDAYKMNRAEILEAQLAEKESKLKIQQSNQNNASTSTGGVNGSSNAPTVALTAESIESMSTTELAKRWSEVKKVLGMK